MDGAAAAGIREDGAGNEPRDGDAASGHDVGPSAGDTADVNQCSIVCKDCGLNFTHLDVFKSHLHQHALEEEEEEEEGEEAQTGDDLNPTADLDSGRADDGENGGDADRCDMSSPLQTSPSSTTQGAGVSTRQLGKIHSCLVCGKVYTYLSSFTKHQRLHESQPPPKNSLESSVQNLSKYQCPHCEMSFIRRARLLGHLRVHRSLKSKPPSRCDQCCKDFNSVQAYMSHIDLHKRKPFWCLSCAKGFIDQELLDKHMLRHNLRKYTCNICHKSFHLSNQLRIHYNTHTGAKPYQCTFCGKRFAQPGHLISHRKKHLNTYVGSSGMLLGIRNSRIFAKKQVLKKKRLCTWFKHEREMAIKEKGGKNNQTEKLLGGAEAEDHANSEVSDCGEPMHHLKLSKPAGSDGFGPPDGLKSERAQQQTRQELDERESQETSMCRENKYWEWECVECDMGFDEVEKLHLHYIKHATGELPIPQDDIEG